MPKEYYQKINYSKNLLWTMMLVSLLSFAFACEDLDNINIQITNHTEALERYDKSQTTINSSLDKIITNTNGIIVKKLISIKKDKFNNLVRDLKESENVFLETASNTTFLICKELNEEDSKTLEENMSTLEQTKSEININKSLVENYIKKDLRKILSDIKDAANETKADVKQETKK